MKRRAPTTFRKFLAVHMAGADRRDHRLPKTALAKIGHLAVGAVLGAVAAGIVLGWMTR
jgi:hypothetical protein